MRSFEFNDGKSNKFWNIELAGKSFTVTYGRVGTAGQTQTKEFATEDKARAAHDKLVAEKTGKGYVEKTARAKVAAVPSSGKALENAIFANPDDLGAHAAYADWLMEQGDPRGEFIQVQLALEDAQKPPKQRKELEKREKELLKKHQRDWLGDLAPYLLDKKSPPVPDWRRNETIKHSWARGWLDTLTIPEIFVNLSRALAKSPHARMLRRLEIEQVWYSDEDEFEPGPDAPTQKVYPSGQALPCAAGVYPLLQTPAFGNLRIFQLGELDKAEQLNCHTDGDPAADLVKKMPRLEELYLLAHDVDLKAIFGLKSLSNLRILQVYHINKEYPLHVLAKNPALGKLTHFLTHPHGLEPDDERAYITFAGVKALVHSPHLKSLTHLRLRLSDTGDKGVTEIIKSGILKRLKVLDIQGGRVSDKGAHALAAEASLPHLELLNISKNMLTNEGIAALKKTRVKLQASEQYGLIPEGEEENYDLEYLWDGDPE